MLGKDQWLDRSRSGQLTHDLFTWDDEQTRMYRDTAVVVGTQTQASTYGDKSYVLTSPAVRSPGRLLRAR